MLISALLLLTYRIGYGTGYSKGFKNSIKDPFVEGFKRGWKAAIDSMDEKFLASAMVRYDKTQARKR